MAVTPLQDIPVAAHRSRKMLDISRLEIKRKKNSLRPLLILRLINKSRLLLLIYTKLVSGWVQNKTISLLRLRTSCKRREFESWGKENEKPWRWPNPVVKPTPRGSVAAPDTRRNSNTILTLLPKQKNQYKGNCSSIRIMMKSYK